MTKHTFGKICERWDRVWCGWFCLEKSKLAERCVEVCCWCVLWKGSTLYVCFFFFFFPLFTYLSPDNFLRPTLITSTFLKLCYDIPRWQLSKYTVQALNDSCHFLSILVIYVQVSLWDMSLTTTTREDNSVQEFWFIVPDAYIIICSS